MANSFSKEEIVAFLIREGIDKKKKVGGTI